MVDEQSKTSDTGEKQALSVKDLREVLQTSPDRLAEFLDGVHAADAADWLQDFEDEEARQVFFSLDTEARAELLEYAEEPLRRRLIDGLSVRQLIDVVEELPADEVVDLLALVDEATSEAVLRGVDLDRARELRELGSYPADTAGGQMTTEFLAVPADSRIGDVIKEIKQEGEEAEEFSGVYVVDAEQRPIGFVPDRALLTHSIHQTVGEVMAEPHTVDVTTDQEEAANVLTKYSLESLAVVDADGRLVGIFDPEDAADVLEEEASEDILKLVGTSPTLQTRLPVLTRVRHRIPLQALTVVGGLVTAFILTLATGSDEAGEGLKLLRYIPIVIGLAGNVGIQASTILVRAFATGEVEPDRELSVLGTELLTGLTIGLLCGAATMPIAAMMEGGIGPGGVFGLAVGLAIATAVTWAAFLGCVVPMGCRRVGIDPAVVAGPFLITLSDISGTGIFVLVAYLVLGN